MSLDSVLPDGVDDGGREFYLKVKEENNTVLILKAKSEGESGEKRFHVKSSSPFMTKTHFNEIDTTLQTVGALEVSTQPFVLVPDKS